MKKALLKLTITCLTFSVGTAWADDVHKANTRFGLADGSGSVLEVNRHPAVPKVEGGDLFVEKITETEKADYLLLTEVGGSACPALYSIAKVTAHSAEPIAFFGNCSDEPKKTVIQGKSITFTFPSYRPLRFKASPEATYVYDIPTGHLTKDGKPISTECKSGVCG